MTRAPASNTQVGGARGFAMFEWMQLQHSRKVVFLVGCVAVLDTRLGWQPAALVESSVQRRVGNPRGRSLGHPLKISPPRSWSASGPCRKVNSTFSMFAGKPFPSPPYSRITSSWRHG